MAKVQVTIQNIYYPDKSWGGLFDSNQEAQEWIQNQINKPFRKEQRWVREDLATDFEKSVSTNSRQVPAGGGETYTEISVPKEFTVDVVDITQQFNRERKQEKLKLVFENALKRLAEDYQGNTSQEVEEAYYRALKAIIDVELSNGTV